MSSFLRLSLSLTLISFSYLSFGQITIDNNKEIQVISVQNDSQTIKSFAFMKDKEYKHQNNLWYTSYFRNQIFQTQGSHVGRLLHGKHQEFDEQMRLTSEGEYIHGLKYGHWRYWQEGRLIKTIQWRNGQMQGRFKEYDENGQLLVEAHYKKNLLHGWHHIFEESKIVSTVKYRKGDEIITKKEVEKDSEERESFAIQETSPKPESSSSKRYRVRKAAPQVIQKENENYASANGSKVEKEYIKLFITDKASQQPLYQASIKVNQFSNSNQNNHFDSFGYTDKDGYYQFPKDSSDYVLLVTHEDFTPHQLRIDQKNSRTSYHIILSKKKECGELVGQVQPASKNLPLMGVTIFIKDESKQLIQTTFSNTQGHFTVCLPCNERYTVHLEKDGYQNIIEQVFLPANCEETPQYIATYLPSLKHQLLDHNTPKGPEIYLTETPSESRSSSPQIITTPTKAVFFNTPGEFKIIAGTFSSLNNALKRLEELKLAGFSEAAIIQIEDSDYFAVYLGNLSSQNAAEAIDH